INNGADKGKKENRSKVARGSLPTFDWLQEADGTWRLLHIPIDINSRKEIIKLFDGHFDKISEVHRDVAENLVEIRKWILSQEESEIDLFQFYEYFLREILVYNGVENFEILDFSNASGINLDSKKKEAIFDEIHRLSSTDSKLFVRGGKVVNNSTDESFDRVKKIGQYLLFENKNNMYWRVNKNEWKSIDFSLKGNIEHLIYSGCEAILGHTPWYSHLDFIIGKENSLEAITPMACHDYARAGDNFNSRRLNPLGYSSIDYRSTHIDLLIAKLLGKDIFKVNINFFSFMYKHHPQVKEKAAKSQRQGASKFYT
ncbi:hypothetical protein L1D59_23840, partial [Pseudoalteromonas piscicida]|uniref:hypothetical protein n=1 Tax=Pseudoalteromonas piscicida TaxID=43662 RepID=UPI001EFDD54D